MVNIESWSGLKVRYRKERFKERGIVQQSMGPENLFLIYQIFSEINVSLSLITFLVTLKQERELFLAYSKYLTVPGRNDILVAVLHFCFVSPFALKF